MQVIAVVVVVGDVVAVVVAVGVGAAAGVFCRSVACFFPGTVETESLSGPGAYVSDCFVDVCFCQCLSFPISFLVDTEGKGEC